MPENATGWASLLAVLALMGCGSDRTAGGTTGTEAGNALSARLSLPDGSAASGALVVVRPSASTSSADEARWIRDTADPGGGLSLRLPEGAWTLEARWQGYGLRADLVAGVDQALRDTLVPLRRLQGEILGTGGGALVSLPGLGVSVLTDDSGRFAIDSVPSQQIPLGIEGRSSWVVPAQSASILVAAANPGLVYRDGAPLRLSGLGMVWEIDTLGLPSGELVLLDGNDREIGSRWERVRGERRRFRVGKSLTQGSTVRLFALASRGSDPAPEVFGEGFRLAVVPELDSSLANLSSGGGSFRATSASLLDTSEGRVLAAPLGSAVGSLDSSALPSLGAFAFALRARVATAGVESLGLVDWTDPVAGTGLHLGIGGGKLDLRVGGRDTSVAWDPGLRWFGAALSWDGQILTVATDGAVRLRWALADGLANRSSWSRREVGLGGGLRMSALYTFAQARDAMELSSPVGNAIR